MPSFSKDECYAVRNSGSCSIFIVSDFMDKGGRSSYNYCRRIAATFITWHVMVHHYKMNFLEDYKMMMDEVLKSKIIKTFNDTISADHELKGVLGEYVASPEKIPQLILRAWSSFANVNFPTDGRHRLCVAQQLSSDTPIGIVK